MPGTPAFRNGNGSSNGSVIDYRVDLKMRGAARLLDRGLQLALSGMGENAVSGLEKHFGSR